MKFPEWAKVLVGSLALLIGASAPSLVMFVLNPSLFVPTFLASSATPIRETPRVANNHKVAENNHDHKKAEPFFERAIDDPVADATMLLAIATVWLAFVGWQAAKDTRRALLLAQRPRIRIRNVIVKPPRIPSYTPMIFFPRQLIDGQLYIVNVGGTEATLIEAHCEVYWENVGVHTLPMERPYEGENPSIPSLRISLQPGQSIPLPFGSTKQIDERELDQILAGHLLIYVLGFVAYIDKLGMERRTAFCRQYDHLRRRFFAVEDPDYEHEE